MPLVDVMLVLLIIFMVTAPMMQQGLQVNLPQARRAHAGHRAAGLRHRARRISQARIVQIGKDECGSTFSASACARRCWRARTSRCSFAPMAGVTVQDIAAT